MKRRVLKVLLILIFTLGIYCFIKGVKANSINSIDMKIKIDMAGNARVTEVWDCKTSKGTECYHPYFNIGESEIKDLTVKDNYQQYESQDYWSTRASFDTKANTCGLVRKNNNVEICWGISKYGENTYTVSYTITDFVLNLRDSQMTFWTLIPSGFSSKIGKVNIEIEGTKKFNPSNVKVMGYGEKGCTSEIVDGKIIMKSKNKVTKNEYMTLLIEYPKEYFPSVANDKYTNKGISYYYNLSETNQKEYTAKIKDTFHAKFLLIVFFVGMVLFYILIYLVDLAIHQITGPSDRNLQYSLKTKLPRDVAYFRDIPLKNNIIRAFVISYMFGIIKEKKYLIGAILLKWSREKRVVFEIRAKNNSNKKEVIIHMVNQYPFVNQKESDLYDMIKEASIDGTLEGKELIKWSNKHYTKITNWFEHLIRDEKLALLKENLVIKKESTIIKGKENYYASQALYTYGMELKGLKKFLLNYTLVKERNTMEVVLLEEYLIFAQMFGIAKKVSKEFKNIYPNLTQKIEFYSLEDYRVVNHVIERAYTRSSMDSFMRSLGSSSGGSSSGGGGGGSFGGGGSRRRIQIRRKNEKEDFIKFNNYFNFYWNICFYI